MLTDGQTALANITAACRCVLNETKNLHVRTTQCLHNLELILIRIIIIIIIIVFKK
jgi:hypothetical protein